MNNQPTIWRRARIALDVFRRGFPPRAYLPSPEGKARGVLGWPTLGDAQPDWHLIDYRTYVEEGVNINAVIYSAIRYKQNAISAAPLRAYGGDVDHPERLKASHPLSNLVERPNPYQDMRTMQALADAYLNISGNAYFWLKRPKRGTGLPEAIHCPRPDRVFVVPEKESKWQDGHPVLLGYLYVPEGKSWSQGTPILPKDMMHIKLFNPMDRLGGLGEGLSPLSAGAYSTDVDNDITKFLKLFFERGGVPPFWFMFEEPLEDTDIARIRERYQEVYGGYEGWTRPGVLDKGGDVKRVGMTFEEMGFSTIDERNESRILGPLGVPPILIGSRMGLERSTYSNYAEARRHFWEDTMTSELGLFEAEYRYYLRSEDGGFVGFDTSRVPALQRDIPQVAEAAYKLWQMGVPANKAFETVGLAIEDVPGGDTGYVPLGVYPVSGSPPKLPPTEEGAAEAEEEAAEGRKAYLVELPQAKKG